MKTEQTAKPLAGAILVGGRSRRMGENKALLKLKPDGPTVLESTIDKMRLIVDDLCLVGSTEGEYDQLGYPVVPDQHPNKGPLGGICSALLHSQHTHVLVVACDMPFLSVPLLRFMATVPHGYDALVPVVDRVQPLHAIYSMSSLPMIENSLASGSPKVTRWFNSANVHFIEQDTVSLYDPDLLSTFNMNTPENVDHARKFASELHRNR